MPTSPEMARTLRRALSRWGSRRAPPPSSPGGWVSRFRTARVGVGSTDARQRPVAATLHGAFSTIHSSSRSSAQGSLGAGTGRMGAVLAGSREASSPATARNVVMPRGTLQRSPPASDPRPWRPFPPSCRDWRSRCLGSKGRSHSPKESVHSIRWSRL